MRDKTVPVGRALASRSPLFTQDTLTQAFSEEHTLAAGRWGVLQELKGTLIVVDLATGNEFSIAAPDSATIAPEVPHKLRLNGPVQCVIDFFRHPKN